jgi:hypothetical protein
LATHQKNQEADPTDCKAPLKGPGSPQARPRAADGGYSQSWMRGFLADVGATGDLAGGLTRAGLSFVEYRRARNQDLAFDLACLDLDQSVRLAAISAVEAKAAGGDLGAIKLLAKGLGQLAPALDRRPADGDPLEEFRADPRGHYSQSPMSRFFVWTEDHRLSPEALAALEVLFAALVDLDRKQEDPLQDLRKEQIFETLTKHRCHACGWDDRPWWLRDEGPLPCRCQLGPKAGPRTGPIGSDPGPPEPRTCPKCGRRHETPPNRAWMCPCGTSLEI